MERIRHYIDELAQSFEQFKSVNNERLSSLEKTGHGDSLIDQKLNRLNERIENTYDHLNKLQLSLKRPELADLDSYPSFADQEQKSAFLNYVRKGDASKLFQMEEKALNTVSGEDGGYLIPQVFYDRIGRELADLSPIRALAHVITISSSGLDLLIDKDSGTVGWSGEQGDREETEGPQLRKIQIPAHELYAKNRATQKLLDDARINIEEWLSRHVSFKMARAENKAFLYGDGQKMPKGLMTYPTADRSDAENGKIQHILTGEVGNFSPDNPGDVLIEAMNAMKPEFQRDAVWLMSRSVHAAVRKLKDRNGNYMWFPGLGPDATPTLLGYKVVIIEDMPSLTPKKSCNGLVFGNLKEGYMIVDRAGIHVLRDPYTAKPYVEFYMTKRVGGDVINCDAFKMIRFSDRSKDESDSDEKNPLDSQGDKKKKKQESLI